MFRTERLVNRLDIGHDESQKLQGHFIDRGFAQTIRIFVAAKQFCHVRLGSPQLLLGTVAQTVEILL